MDLTPLLPTMTTPLVRLIEETSRVTTTPAALGTLLVNVPCTSVLAPALIVSAELLRTSTPGPPTSVWVTYRCRPRLFEMPALFRLTHALHPLGKFLTNLLV